MAKRGYHEIHQKSIPGIVVCALIAALATFLGKLELGKVSLEVIGAPVFAILIGMIITLLAPTFAGSVW